MLALGLKRLIDAGRELKIGKEGWMACSIAA
jgi:hypothetical protein